MLSEITIAQKDFAMKQTYAQIAGALLICLSLDAAKTSTPPSSFEKDIYTWSKTMAEAFHVVDKKYYQPIDVSKAMVKAINSFVALDPHSGALDPKSYEDLLQTTQGEFYGIGVVIHSLKEPDDEFVMIVDTIPGGPADKAEIKGGDKIIQINDELVKGMSLDEAVTKMKGKKGTTVNVKITRGTPGQLKSFTVTRDVIKEQNVTGYYFPEHNIDYLALNLFTENSVKQVEQVLKKSKAHKAKAVILDLRNNSGGRVDSVVDIAGLFLPPGSVVVRTKNEKKEILEEYKTKGEPIADTAVPIFVLVNNFTASAAEILAGVLRLYSQEHNKQLVFITGTESFGKGSVQELVPLSNECALKITIGLYYFHDNSCLQKTGITPDFIIKPKLPPTAEMEWMSSHFGKERALKNALTLDKKEQETSKKDHKEKPNEDEEKSWKQRRQEAISSDHQILSTIRLIEMLDLGLKAYPQQLKKRADIVNFMKKKYNTDEKLIMQEVTL